MNGEFPLQIHFKLYRCTCIKHKFDNRHQGCLMGPSNIGFDFLSFNATFNNISAISWRPVLVEEAGENHRPWASNW
jgi:hypothetical protein